LNLGTYPSEVEYSSSFSFRKSPATRKDQVSSLIESSIPVKPFLEQNYPNPFNPATEIRYGLSDDTWVTLKVFNLLGQELATLVNEFQKAGARSVKWNGTNDAGSKIGSGVYIYRLTSGKFVQFGKMTMVK
jgi:hypothetical protein